MRHSSLVPSLAIAMVGIIGCGSSTRGMSRMSPATEVEMQLVWLPARQETSDAGLLGRQ